MNSGAWNLYFIAWARFKSTHTLIVKCDFSPITRDPLLVNFHYSLFVFLTAKRVLFRSAKRIIATSIATRIHSRPKLLGEDKSISIITRDTRSSIERLVGRSLSREDSYKFLFILFFHALLVSFFLLVFFSFFFSTHQSHSSAFPSASVTYPMHGYLSLRFYHIHIYFHLQLAVPSIYLHLSAQHENLCLIDQSKEGKFFKEKSVIFDAIRPRLSFVVLRDAS